VRGRYVIWCIPYVAALAALAVLGAPRAGRRTLTAVVLVAIVLANLGWSLAGYHAHGGGRVAAARIRSEARALAGDDLVVILGNGPPREAMRLAGWNVDRTLRIPTPAIPRAERELAARLDRRLVLVTHQQTEASLRLSGLWGDPRLELRRRIPDRTRRQELHYSLYVWEPGP
jgi:hypothetical protein